MKTFKSMFYFAEHYQDDYWYVYSEAEWGGPFVYEGPYTKEEANKRADVLNYEADNS